MADKVLIQFRGKIGAGKTTALRKLKDYFESQPETVLFLQELSDDQLGIPMEHFYSAKIRQYAWQSICFAHRKVNQCKALDFLDAEGDGRRVIVEDRNMGDVVAFSEMMLDNLQKLTKQYPEHVYEAFAETCRMKQVFENAKLEWKEHLENLARRGTRVAFVFFDAEDEVVEKRISSRSGIVSTRKAEAAVFRSGAGTKINRILSAWTKGGRDRWNIVEEAINSAGLKFSYHHFDSSGDDCFDSLLPLVKSIIG